MNKCASPIVKQLKVLLFTLCLFAQSVSYGMESSDATRNKSKISQELSPFKHHTVLVKPSAKNNFDLNLDLDDHSILVDYQYAGKSVAQLIAGDKKMFLKSLDPEGYNFTITNPVRTGDFNSYLQGKLTLQESLDASGSALVAGKTLRNKKGLVAGELCFNGEKLINDGSLNVSRSDIEQCKKLINNGKWVVEKDCYLRKVEELRSAPASSWSVGGALVGAVKELHLEGASSARDAALLSVESKGVFDGPFDTPIFHTESKGTLVTTPRAQFCTNHHLALKAKELVWQGDLTEKLPQSSSETTQYHKMFQHGVCLQAEDALCISGAMHAQNKPTYLVAKNIGLLPKSVVESDNIVVAAQEHILQQGTMNAQASLSQGASKIEVIEGSSVVANDACMYAREKLSHNGSIRVNNVLTMRSNQLYNGGTIESGNAHFKADCWWLNEGRVNTQNELKVDALVSINALLGFIQAKKLQINSLADLNLLGVYKAQNADINALWRLNAGLYLPQMHSWRDFITVDNVVAASERLLSLVKPSVTHHAQMAKAFDGLFTAGKGIYSLAYQWGQLPKTYTGASDVMPLLGQSARMGLSIFRQVKAFENLGKSEQNCHEINVNNLASVKAVRSVAEPFFPSQNCISIMDTNAGITTGINGQFTNVYNDNFGAALVAHNYKVDTRYGTDGGVVAASTIDINAAKSYVGQSTAHMMAVEATIDADAVDVDTTIDAADQVTLKAETKADIGIKAQSNNKINIIAPDAHLKKECHLDSKSGTVSVIAASLTDEATIDAHLVQMQASKATFKDGSHLNLHGDGATAIVQADNFVAEGGSHFVVPRGTYTQESSESSMIIVAKNTDLQNGSSFDLAGSSLKVMGEKISDAAAIDTRIVHMQASEVALKNGSVVHLHGDAPVAIMQSDKFIAEDGSNIAVEAQANQEAKIIINGVITDLQKGSSFDAGHGALQCQGKSIANAAEVSARIVHVKADDVMLKDGSALNLKGNTPVAVVQSQKLIAENGSKIIAEPQASVDTRVILNAPVMDLQKGSHFDPAQGWTQIESNELVINASMKGKAQLEVKKVTFEKENKVDLQGLQVKAEDRIIQKGNLNAAECLLRAKYVENSGKITTAKGTFKADRYYWNTGNVTSSNTLQIDTPLSVNFRSYTRAKNLTTNALIDIDLFSCDKTGESTRSSLLALDLSLHLPMLSMDMIASEKGLKKFGDKALCLVLPPHLKAIYKMIQMACGIKSLASQGRELYKDFKTLYSNKEATTSDWVPLINRVVALAMSSKQMVNAVQDMSAQGTQAKEEREKNPTKNDKNEKDQNHRNKLTSQELISMAGSLVDQGSSRTSLVDLNGGLTVGINATSTNVVDKSTAKICANYNLDTCYGQNLGFIAAGNASVSAKNYKNGISANIAGHQIETPAAIVGAHVAIKTDSFKGSAHSTVATAGGGISLEVKEIDNKGSIHGDLKFKFIGRPDQLKSIGTVNLHGGSFNYNGAVATADTAGTNLPTADELAEGSGKWGQVKNAGEIQCDAGKQDVHLKKQHDVKHTFTLKTDGSIQADQKISSQRSIGLIAGKDLCHDTLVAAGNVQRVAREGTITATSTVERVHNGANYEDRIKQVSVIAGKANTAYAGKDIIQTAVEVKAGKEGITLAARGNIADNSLNCERHTERKTATEEVKDMHVDPQVSCYTTPEGMVKIRAGGIYDGQGTKFDAAGEPEIYGMKGTNISDVHAVHTQELHKTKSKWWPVPSSNQASEKTVTHKSLGPQFDGHGKPFTIGTEGSPTRVVAAQSDVPLILKGNVAQLEGGKNVTLSQKESQTTYVWSYESKSGESRQDVTYSQPQAPSIENHAEELVVQSVKNLTCEYLNKIQNVGQGKITEVTVEEMHHVDVRSSGQLTTGAKVVLGISIGLLTKGMGAPLVAGLSSWGVSSAAATVLSHATVGTVNCLLNQAVNTLVETGGDIQKAAELMAASQTLKGVAFAALSAGVTSGADQAISAIGMPVVQDASNIAQRIAYATPREFIHAGIRTGLAAVAGQPIEQTLSEQARLFVGKTLHTVLVSQIADLYASGEVNSITHKVLHGAAGATYGAIIGGSRGALAGGIGAFTAEVAAEIAAPSKRIMEAVIHFEHAHGVALNQQEFMACYGNALQEYMHKTFTAQQVAQMAAAMSALAVGQDVDIAHQASLTALDNNFLILAGYGIVAGSVAYSGYKIYKSYEEEGAVGALKQLGIEIAYNAAGQVVGRVGGMMYPSIKAATIAVLDEAPALKFALGNIADKLIVAVEKINGTAIGKAVSKVEAALIEQEAKLLGKFGLGGAVEAQVTRAEEHAVEELVLADSGIRIKVNRDVEKEVSALSKTAAIVPDKKRAIQAVKTETASLQPTREKMLPKMKTYDEARNKASEIIGEVDPHSAVPHIEELYTCKDKLCGLKWEKNKVVMRLDYDPIKGPHINVADFRRAIGDDKFAIPFESDEKTIKSLLKHLNTKSSLEKAKMIYVESKNEKDLIRITGMIENLNKKRSKYEKRF